MLAARDEPRPSRGGGKRNDAGHTVGRARVEWLLTGPGDGPQEPSQAALTILLLRMQRVQASV